MLTVDNIYAGYGASEVLIGTSLQVKAGGLVALIGPNGAGKTTTMRAISGLIKPTKGRVLLDNKPVHGMDASQIAKLGLAHVPEGRRVFGPLSVEDNLLLGDIDVYQGYSDFAKRLYRTWSGSMSCFPVCRSGATRQPELFQEVNSRCLQSAVH